MTGRLPTALVLSALLAPMFVSGAQAQVVHRCVGADGSSVFSDKPCSTLGLVPKNAPPASATPQSYAGADLSLEMDFGPVAASEGCPGPDAEALRERLETAVNQRDLNALTGMYHWASAGRASASHVINRMQSLIEGRPVSVVAITAEPNDDWLWAGLPPPDELDKVGGLEVRSAQGSGSPLTRFQLRSQAGCLWLAGY